MQVGWPVGMPLCRSLGGGLWEVRQHFPSRRIARVLFFCMKGGLALCTVYQEDTEKRRRKKSNWRGNE